MSHVSRSGHWDAERKLSGSPDNYSPEGRDYERAMITHMKLTDRSMNITSLNIILLSVHRHSHHAPALLTSAYNECDCDILLTCCDTNAIQHECHF